MELPRMKRTAVLEFSTPIDVGAVSVWCLDLTYTDANNVEHVVGYRVGCQVVSGQPWMNDLSGRPTDCAVTIRDPALATSAFNALIAGWNTAFVNQQACAVY